MFIKPIFHEPIHTIQNISSAKSVAKPIQYHMQGFKKPKLHFFFNTTLSSHTCILNSSFKITITTEKLSCMAVGVKGNRESTNYLKGVGEMNLGLVRF